MRKVNFTEFTDTIGGEGFFVRFSCSLNNKTDNGERKGEDIMQIISGCTDFKLTEKSAVAIGKFDGIHIGHKVLLLHLMEQKKQGLKSVVFTFYPSAASFFGKAGEAELTPLSEKRAYFEMLGVDILIEFPLNKDTAAIPADMFIEEILVKKMNTAYIAAGTDLSFGAGGKGDGRLLYEMSRKLGYKVEIIDKILFENREISSSYVREAVEQGDMKTAALLLGRMYGIMGTVERGKRLGRKLGMPTLNIYPEKDKLLPPRGVYYSTVNCSGREYKAITNIGSRPTVNDTDAISVETFLYEYEGDLYGEEITVAFAEFKRAEKKFESVEALKAQMERDVAEGRAYHGLEDVTKG